MNASNGSRWLSRATLGLYALLWCGGVMAYLVAGGPADSAAWAGTLFMAMAGILVLWHTPARMRLGLALAGTLGFGAEVLGVYTNMPFGGYHYTNAFAPLLFGVPLVMVCAWWVLTAYVLEILRPFQLGLPALAVAGSAGLTAMDLLIDPVAAGPMGLWVWHAPGSYHGIPLTNFVGWFVVGLGVITVAALPVPQNQGGSRGPLWIGRSILLFFLLVACGQGLWLAALCGALVLGLDACLSRAAARMPRMSSNSCET